MLHIEKIKGKRGFSIFNLYYRYYFFAGLNLNFLFVSVLWPNEDTFSRKGKYKVKCTGFKFRRQALYARWVVYRLELETFPEYQFVNSGLTLWQVFVSHTEIIFAAERQTRYWVECVSKRDPASISIGIRIQFCAWQGSSLPGNFDSIP